MHSRTKSKSLVLLGAVPMLLLGCEAFVVDMTDGLEPIDHGVKNTILVTMSLDATASMEELAFLAAVPAGMKVNNGSPSVIAVPPGIFGQPDREFYDNYINRYKPDFIYNIGQSSGLDNAVPISSSSLDEITCELARFWQNSATVVMANRNDYKLGLSASALAGRLEAPLFFFESGGASDATMDCLRKLGTQRVVAVGISSSTQNQLQGEGIEVTPIADDLSVISWLQDNGHPVDYFAVCNSGDRAHGYAPKSSLAAPLLAAARGGAVVPLYYPESVFNDGCLIEGSTTTRPPGAADSADGKWRVGVCTVKGVQYDVVLSLQWADFGHNQGNIDLNHDGNFGGNGEFVKRGQVRSFSGLEYLIDINPRRLSNDPNNKHWADVLFTYPTHYQVKSDIQRYLGALTRHPKYMVMVGLPDVLPVALVVYTDGTEVTHFTDQFYIDVDNDPLFDIAEGRFVGENASIFTLAASRAIAYEHLLDNAWKNRVVNYGGFTRDSEMHERMFSNCGFATERIPRWEDIDRTQYSIGVHDDHGWPFGFAPFTEGPIPPVFASTGGCSFGNIIDMIPLNGTISEYKDFAAVKLARTGAIGFNAFSKNSTSDFELMRDTFINAVLFDGATLGEAQLHSVNTAKIRHSEGSENITAPMLYGDPALRIYVPSAGCKEQAPAVQVSGNTVTVSKPETIWCFQDANDQNMPYDYSGPGLSGYTAYEDGKRFIATFTVDRPVSNIVQTSAVQSPLGWSNRFGCDAQPDGTTQCYLNLRFEQIDHTNCSVLRNVSSLSFRFN